MEIRYRLLITTEEKEQLKNLTSKRTMGSKQVVSAQLLLGIAKNGLDKTDQEACEL